MGANMQKQAVPLVRAEAPYVGTGVEAKAARDAADMILAEDDGTIVEIDGDHLVIEYKTRPQEARTPAQVRAVEPGHEHQPEAARARRRSSEEG